VCIQGSGVTLPLPDLLQQSLLGLRPQVLTVLTQHPGSRRVLRPLEGSLLTHTDELRISRIGDPASWPLQVGLTHLFGVGVVGDSGDTPNVHSIRVGHPIHRGTGAVFADVVGSRVAPASDTATHAQKQFLGKRWGLAGASPAEQDIPGGHQIPPRKSKNSQGMMLSSVRLPNKSSPIVTKASMMSGFS